MLVAVAVIQQLHCAHFFVKYLSFGSIFKLKNTVRIG